VCVFKNTTSNRIKKKTRTLISPRLEICFESAGNHPIKLEAHITQELLKAFFTLKSSGLDNISKGIPILNDY